MLPLPLDDQTADATLRKAWDALSAAIFSLMQERDTWLTRYRRQKLDAQTTDDDYRALEQERDAAISRAEALEVDNKRLRDYITLRPAYDSPLPPTPAPPAADHTERARENDPLIDIALAITCEIVALGKAGNAGIAWPVAYKALAAAERTGAEKMREQAAREVARNAGTVHILPLPGEE